LKKSIIFAISSLILTASNVWQANASSPESFIHERITRSVTFSDSLSDTGNLFIVSGFPPATIYFPPSPRPFTGNPSPGYDQGRFANGPVWIDDFVQSLGLDPSSSLPSNPGGTNYSWGGAETGFGKSTRDTPNIGTQIKLFQADNPEESKPLDSQEDLVVLWAGANDYVNNQNNQDPNDNPEHDIVGNIRMHLEDLIELGGRHFLVANMPALGQLPRFVNTDSEAQFDRLSTQFNEELSSTLKDLEETYEIAIFRFNAFDLFLQMVNKPSVFGFENVTGTAKSVVGEDPNTFFFGTVVDNPEEYIFFDDVHPTTRTHEILGDFAVNAFMIGSLVEALINGKVEIGGNKPEKIRDRLVKKLTRAQNKIDQGKFNAAIGKLKGFKGKIKGLANSGKLDEDTAQSMIEAADSVIASLSAYIP